MASSLDEITSQPYSGALGGESNRIIEENELLRMMLEVMHRRLRERLGRLARENASDVEKGGSHSLDRKMTFSDYISAEHLRFHNNRGMHRAMNRSYGSLHEDSDIEKGGSPCLVRVHGKPRQGLPGDWHDFAPEDSDIEKGGSPSLEIPSFDETISQYYPGEQSFSSPLHSERSDRMYWPKKKRLSVRTYWPKRKLSSVSLEGGYASVNRSTMPSWKNPLVMELAEINRSFNGLHERLDPVHGRVPSPFPGFSFMGKACPQTFSTSQACEGHILSHLGLTPTMPDASVNRSTMHNHVSSGDFIGPAHADGVVEKGGSHSLGHVHSFPRSGILVDPLFDMNVQGAFALVAFKTNNGSSPAKDVLLYLLVFVYVLGFLAALGGKLFNSSKMGGIGSVAAALGFLMTMALLLI